MKLPKVSIIIPSYNYQEYVCQAVDSCLDQEYGGEIEVIVVDDCSTDCTVPTLAQYGNRIKLIRHHVNRGYSAAKNSGIRASSGDLIVLLDADDMFTIDSIKVRAEYLAAHPEIDMVHGRAYVIIGPGNALYWWKRLKKIGVSKKDKIHAQTTMIRRSVHLRFGLYDETLRSRSDNEMWHRLNLYGEFPGMPKISAIRIDEPPFAYYRKHEKSMIEFRRANPGYNYDVTAKLEAAKQMRAREGAHPGNTPWLKK